MPEQSQPTLMVIDGHSLAFRAFYALPLDSFQTADGQHTNAIHGFISMMLNLIAKEKPTHLAVAFDISRYSFRTREYPEYKATRGETPPEFRGQVPLLQEALHAMNIVTLTKEDFEADDILATLAERGAKAGYRVLVVSGDRDTIQLVNDSVTLLYPSKQGVSELTRYDAAKVFERYGIAPHQYPEIAALVGETSDNLPGIPKVGEKTAVKWINEFGSLEEILRRSDEIPGKVGESLREHADNARRNRRLNRLVTDVDLDVELDSLTRTDPNVEAVRDIFAKLQFRSLLTRVIGGSTAEAASTAASKANPAQATSRESYTQGASSAHAVDMRGRTVPETLSALSIPASPAVLDEELATWLDSTQHTAGFGVGFTVVANDGEIISLGLACGDRAISVPWSPHKDDMIPLLEWFGSDVPKVTHGAKPALKVLAAHGVTVNNLVFDLDLADWIIRPDVSKRDLADLAARYSQGSFPESDPDQLVPEVDGLEPGSQAWVVLHVSQAVHGVMTATELALLLDIELPSLLTLASMESRGVAVDASALALLREELARRAGAEASAAYEAIGREVNLASPKQLQEVLFEQLQMPKTRATKTGYTTDAAALQELQQSNPHPFLEHLLAHRDVTKLGQIVETLDSALSFDGRIHTTYLQTGTSTGRLSSLNPNLQNIPVRSEDGRRIRDAFTVGEGFDVLVSADYSQIEMRVMAHFSQDEGLIEAFHSGEDLHRFVGARVFGVSPQHVTPDMRSQVKAMSYGLAYGLSAFGLAKQLGIENKVAKQLMSDYFVRFGGVRDYLRSVVDDARERGYTETLFGRRRPFPDLNSPNRILREAAERQALNAPMQGTAADIMKIAMVSVERELLSRKLNARLLMQVHDELVIETTTDDQPAVIDIVTEAMSTAATLRVPLEVHIGVGKTWNQAAH